MKKTTFIIVMIIALVAALGGCTSTPSAQPAATGSAPEQSAQPAPTPAPAKPSVEKYGTGTYLVGKDLSAGYYRVTITDKTIKAGYVARLKDLKSELDSILANIILYGNGYVQVMSTDVAVKLQGVEIEPIKLDELKPSIKKEAGDGIHLIGYDLAPGTYKVELTDKASGMGYVQRSKSVAMGGNDIIANDIIQGPSYIEIRQGDFAVLLQGVKITAQ